MPQSLSFTGTVLRRTLGERGAKSGPLFDACVVTDEGFAWVLVGRSLKISHQAWRELFRDYASGMVTIFSNMPSDLHNLYI